MSAGRFRLLGKLFDLSQIQSWWDHNWRQAEQAVSSLETGVTGGAVLLAGRSGGQGISSATAADEQLGIGIANPAYLLDLSAPGDASLREVLVHAVVEDATRDRFAILNSTLTSARFAPFVLGQVETSSAVACLAIQSQTNVSNDTGTTPLLTLMARRYPDAEADTFNSASYSDIATRPILEVRNRGTGALRVEANLDIKALGGHLTIETAGKGLKIKEGSNARMGVATLVAGTVTVSNTSVTASTRIFLTAQDVNTQGSLRVSARTAGTSFTILSSNLADTGVVAWLLLEPA